MTDKSPQNKEKNSLNTPPALTKATDTTHDSAQKSKILPQADALKERFKAGSIPLQTDFADLIDLANIGRQAVGDEASGWGLTNDNINRLQFDPSKIHDLIYDLTPDKAGTWQVLSDLYAGITINHSRIALLAVNEEFGPTTATNEINGDSTSFNISGIKIDSEGVRTEVFVKIIAAKKIGANDKVVPCEYVKDTNSSYSLWYKFTLDSSSDDFKNCTLLLEPLTLVVRCVTNASSDPIGEMVSLINVNFVYMGVVIGDGLQAKNMKISAKVNVDKGLNVTSSGIEIKLNEGSGLSVGATNGLMIDPEQMFRTGMIMMFSGASVPSGWALCDGTLGTPDLRDRFILGAAAMSSIGKTNNDAKVTGNDTNKVFLVNSDLKLADIKVEVEGHVLAIDEMPSHQHNLRTIDDPYLFKLQGGKSGTDFGSVQVSSSLPSGSAKAYADNAGGNKQHTHNALVNQQTHLHSTNVVPPYLTLAFIMKK